MESKTLSERELLDLKMSKQIDVASRQAIWGTSERVMGNIRPALIDGEPSTVMVLGYVQSGKTTSMSTLMALAADEGIDIVIAFLGSTTLLLDQNALRLSESLGIHTRNDYQWTEMKNPSSKTDTRQLINWVSKGRTIFVPLLKHAKRIDALATVLSDPQLNHRRVLIIDDEADQASLNTLVKKSGESRTYESIVNLRNTLTNHAYVQFTATPYALLLLNDEDSLFPNCVELLKPGTGYTGGKEFFIDERDNLIHAIPRGDEQGNQLPIGLQRSLKQALATFLIGAADLLRKDPSNAPVSMLVHPHSKTTIQERYRFLIQNYFDDLRDLLVTGNSFDDLGLEFSDQFNLLKSRLNLKIAENEIWTHFQNVVNEAHISLLNSTTDLERIRWNESPVHLLIGGNKLDRGFTVEGLTVTYMNRQASDQVDTTEQRARAFGYRREYLPYCQFFSTGRTISLLTDIVRTEMDLRHELEDAFLRGETVREWSEKVGLLLPEGSKPTRDAVVSAVTVNQLGWHYVRRPSRDSSALKENWDIVNATGLMNSQTVDYGRLSFRTLEYSSANLIGDVLEKWQVPEFSPNWHREHLLEVVSRSLRLARRCLLVLMDVEVDGERRPRLREWRQETGFVNIFQGRDNSTTGPSSRYLGDRHIGEKAFEEGDLMIQIHRVMVKDDPSEAEMLVPAIFLGNRRQIRNK
jgi:hypothetical protein